MVLGYQGLQGLILPVMDQVKNNGILTAAKSVPGVGNLVGGAAQTLVGSTMLIKSAIGVGGVIGFVCVVFYPLLKMGIFTCWPRLWCSRSAAEGFVWQWLRQESVENCCFSACSTVRSCFPWRF